MCLKASLFGMTRYAGIMIFLPVSLILVLYQDGLTSKDTYAIYGLILLVGFLTIMLFFIGIQSFAEFRSYVKRLS